ncbi:unnamed protein product [Rotaria sp. Silwood2]|nr:unnamed protein product [Rotaria sp. Silwood2]CAF3965126.1 unnamed protein product [Rotaria sp. Silwood2]
MIDQVSPKDYVLLFLTAHDNIFVVATRSRIEERYTSYLPPVNGQVASSFTHDMPQQFVNTIGPSERHDGKVSELIPGLHRQAALDGVPQADVDEIVAIIQPHIVAEGSVHRSLLSFYNKPDTLQAKETLTSTLVHLYTRETFLYKMINRHLRELNQTALRNLAPLINWMRAGLKRNASVSTTYRVAQLTPQQIAEYQEGLHFCWPAFTSTKRDPKVAES